MKSEVSEIFAKKMETRTIASKINLDARRQLAKLERCSKNNAGEMLKIAKNWDWNRKEDKTWQFVSNDEKSRKCQNWSAVSLNSKIMISSASKLKAIKLSSNASQQLLSWTLLT